MEESLTAKAKNFSSYYLALDESTDIRFASQLAIFICGVDDNFEIIKELAATFPLKGTTRGFDLLEGVMATTKRLGLSLSNLSEIATDGVP